MTDPVVLAERTAIGSALCATANADVLLGLVDVEQFSRPYHRQIWRAVTDLRAVGAPVSPATVAAQLDVDGIRALPSNTYLTDLYAAAPTDTDGVHYARMVAEYAAQRRLRAAGERLARLAESPDPDVRAAGLAEAREALGRLAGPAASEAEPERRRSWRAVDIGPVLAGTYEPPRATVGRRDDGVGLFYPGRMHTIASESEAGKTWLALLAVRAELEAGNAVVYLDFEDDEGGIVGRLLAMQVKPELLRDRFAYLKPDDAVNVLGNREDLAEVLGDLRPTLAVLDGVTEAMSLHGLEMKDNTDVAAFGKLLPRWIADRGPATVALDHVTKSAEGRGRYAIGGVHKLNGLNGAGYVLENRRPFGVGLTGRSGVYITKDRPAQLRRHALPGREGLFWFGDLVVTSHEADFVEVSLAAPVANPDTGLRPTAVMTKLSRILADNPGGLSKNAIEQMAGGKAAVVRTALELLVNEGFVLQQKQGAAMVHTHIKPYVIEALEAPNG
ncbi:DnaB-like helicase N-terminal domain-containing protein [Plantactinospora sp. WMMB782]|uniref:DnaB-like helicase N-terminal domain-containing protein n=1 Tax=Plantactinospora sp. WMMB782 TaxID=3404121 RepID=UPI003B94DA6C